VTVEVRWLQALANRPEIIEVPAFLLKPMQLWMQL
jgi:hypothetical protein